MKNILSQLFRAKPKPTIEHDSMREFFDYNPIAGPTKRTDWPSNIASVSFSECQSLKSFPYLGSQQIEQMDLQTVFKYCKPPNS